MGQIRDLSAPNQIQKNEWRQRRIERGSPMRSASVSDGGQTQFNGLESITVDGSQIVRGLLVIEGAGGELRIIGELNGDGTINWSGDANFTGSVVLGPGGTFRAADLVIDNTGAGRISHPTILVLSAPATTVNNIGVLADAEISGQLRTGPSVKMALNTVPPGVATTAVVADAAGNLYTA